jgi:hypothetical protein
MSNRFVEDVLRQTVDTGVQPLSHNQTVLESQLRTNSSLLSRDEGTAYDTLKFVREHGMTREEHARRQNEALFYEQFIREYESGDIPATIPAERHLSKARAQYARYRTWLAQTKADLIDLEAAETRLRSMVRAPEATAETVGARLHPMPTFTGAIRAVQVLRDNPLQAHVAGDAEWNIADVASLILCDENAIDRLRQ